MKICKLIVLFIILLLLENCFAQTLSAEIVEPLPESWSSCEDQPITMILSTSGSMSIELQIPSMSATTEYFDTISGGWIPAVDVFYSGWGTYIFPGSSWIWDSHYSGSVLNRCLTFRTIIETPPGVALDSASVVMRCDNTATFFMNGDSIGADDDGSTWIHSFEFDMLPFMHGGSDTLTILACDLTGVAVGLNFLATIFYNIPCRLDFPGIELEVGGTPYTLDDPELMLVDSSYLLWTPPSAVFSDGDTVEVCLDRFANTCGDTLDEPMCWRFFIDTQPPTAVNLFPEPGSLIADLFTAVSADLLDEGSGLDTSTVTMTVNGDLIHDFSLASDGSSWHLEWLPSAPLPSGDSIRVCLSASDTTDYCPDNTFTDCWSFINMQERAVWFPTVFGFPCDTTIVPLYIDGLEGSAISRIEMEFSVDPAIACPISISTASSFTAGWAVSSVEVDSASGRIRAVITGAPLTEGGEGALLNLVLRANCSASGGDYCPIEIDTIWLNSGNPSLTFEDGFFVLDMTPKFFTCPIFLNRTAGTATEDFVLTFGSTASAGPSFDPGLDVQFIPPPSWRVAGWFPIDDPSHPTTQRLSRDMRAIDPPERWLIVTDNEPWGVARWNPASLPEGEFRIGGLVDMKRDSVCYFHRNDTLIIDWTLESPVVSEIELVSGWNMVSCPALPTERTAAEVFNTALGVYRYINPESRYTNTERILAGEGYWVWTPEPRAVLTAGIPVEDYRRSIYPGWNLIGAVATTLPLSGLTSTPTGAIAGDIYQYESGAYIDADSIRPGKAYWLLAIFNATLQAPAGHSRKIPAPIVPSWSAYLISELATLELAFSEYSSTGWTPGDIAIPPSAPQAAASPLELFAEGIAFRRKLSPGEWSLICRERTAIRIDCPDNIRIIIDGAESFNGDIVELPQGKFRIEGSVITPQKLRISRTEPNPFNATTTLIVESPTKSPCKVEVFDILGKKTGSKNLILSPGANRVQWDGCDNRGQSLPTGVYFINVSTEKENIATKVVLIK